MNHQEVMYGINLNENELCYARLRRNFIQRASALITYQSSDWIKKERSSRFVLFLAGA